MHICIYTERDSNGKCNSRIRLVYDIPVKKPILAAASTEFGNNRSFYTNKFAISHHGDNKYPLMRNELVP